MTRPSTKTLATLAVLLVLVEVLAVFFFNMVRRENLIAGMLSIAGIFVSVSAVAILLHQWGGIAWPFSYLPSGAAMVRRHRAESSFAMISGSIDSYLHNQSRADELHPVFTELARDRLAVGHGIDLDDEHAARPVLGQDLANYLYSPPSTNMSRRNRQNLTRFITRIEEL